MKRLCALLLTFILLILGIAPATGMADESEAFRGLNDPSLLPYLEGAMYEQLVTDLDSEDYFVENVQAVYISQEYLDELAFNSQANVYFGYTLEELDAQFQGDKYIFTLGENNETVVEPWTAYDDTYERVIRNVAVGTGVILVCVTVSAVTAGAGAPAMSMIFAMAAKGGAIGALSGAATGGIPAFIATGIQTGDMEAAAKSAAIAGSEGFKWGAICGSISGGAKEAIALKGATVSGLTMNEVAVIQRESKYPLDIIKNFRSMEQYKLFQSSGLKTGMVNNKQALIRDIVLDQIDDKGKTNLQRMMEGLAPLDPQNVPYELHHMGQKVDSTLAILTQTEHRGKGFYLMNHDSGIEEGVHSLLGNKWITQKKNFWMDWAKALGGAL